MVHSERSKSLITLFEMIEHGAGNDDGRSAVRAPRDLRKLFTAIAGGTSESHFPIFHFCNLSLTHFDLGGGVAKKRIAAQE